jgi:hypothetical protein
MARKATFRRFRVALALVVVVGLLPGRAAARRVPAPHALLYGTLVPKDQRTEVTWVVSGSSTCSSVFVGPRVVLTAAHCVEDGGAAIVLDRGRRSSGRGHRPPKSLGDDLDVAVVVLEKPRVGAPYATVGRSVFPGEQVDLFGQGCFDPDTFQSDNRFRRGVSRVAGVAEAEIKIAEPGGAVACFGDSGGPVFRRGGDGESLELVGLISKGDMIDETYATRLGEDRVFGFLASFASAELTLCGVNVPCPATLADGARRLRMDLSPWGLAEW